MHKINTTIELKSAIEVLRIQQKERGLELKVQLKTTFDSLKPANLIKSTITDLVSDSEIKGNFLGKALGFSAGFFSKKLLVGASMNPVVSILGTVLQMGISRFVANNGEKIKEKGLSFIKNLLSKKNPKGQNEI
ncbi:MAG: hypothetical protein K0Q95_2808 [Bacteroidota bacterium]|jgi:hypothetical protein|nr:hypothetical protein [Bacteroidota bacterium]